jgi:hypothetical protein
MHVAESSVVGKLKGECSGGTGPDLTGYPHLVYGAAQWGKGVRIASNGVDAVEVARHASRHPIEYVTDDYRVSFNEVTDALRYARANGLI